MKTANFDESELFKNKVKLYLYADNGLIDGLLGEKHEKSGEGSPLF